jgi:hypothetical protein
MGPRNPTQTLKHRDDPCRGAARCAPCPQSLRVLSSSESPFTPIRMNTTRYLLTNQLNRATMPCDTPPPRSNASPDHKTHTKSRSTPVRISRISSHLHTPKIGRFATFTFQSTCALFGKTGGGIPYTVPIWNSRRTQGRSASKPLLLFWSSNKSSTARPCPLAAESK